MKVFQGSGPNQKQVVISLCDYSGNWPKPWHEAGHTVICYDLKHGDDVTTMSTDDVYGPLNALLGHGYEIVMVLAAPPCTDFTVSGAQYWPAKDADGRTDAALRVLDACVRLARDLAPTRGWALENPVGRIPKLRPELGKPAYYFHPYEYAQMAPDVERERYTKKTGIWGTAKQPTTDREAFQWFGEYRRRPVEPIRVCSQGSWLQKLGGKSERTKELRSMTPMGFARAFYVANRPT